MTRIALFTHSTNPRGGVVHALELAEALTALGHDATIIAPDSGRGFFRPTRARQVTIPAAHCPDLPTLVQTRIDEIATHIAADPSHDYDVWHAHCSITANALLRLTAERRIPGFVRTVHHLDTFADPRLDAWQTAGITEADQLFTVSHQTEAALRKRFGRHASIIGNGVDPARFTPTPDHRDPQLAARLGLAAHNHPLYLAIGGIEARKNTTAILHAFLRVHANQPSARLIVAGGASLLDHKDAQARFHALLARSGAAHAVILPGVIADADMPALYRLSDALVFVSHHEGFGLCPLEAMACGTPAIVSAIAPFTEHFDDRDCLWADPTDLQSIETAMRAITRPDTRARLAHAGPHTAGRFAWPDIARRQLDGYRVRTLAHA